MVHSKMHCIPLHCLAQPPTLAVQQGFSFSSDDGGLMQVAVEDPLARPALLPSLVSLASSELCEARSFEGPCSNFMVALFALSFGLSPINSSRWCRWFLMDTFDCSQMMSD